MSAKKNKGPIVDPGACRCCGATKKCRLLNEEYDFYGQTEIYSEMFIDCFGLVLSHLDGEESERLICATCVVRLRDARAFRTQVLECEQKLLHSTIQVHDTGEYKPKMVIHLKEEDTLSDTNISTHEYEYSVDDNIQDSGYCVNERESDTPIMRLKNSTKFKKSSSGITEYSTVEFKSEIGSDAYEMPDIPRRTLRRRVKKLSAEPLKAKKEMFLKLQKMKLMLNKMQDYNQDGQPEQIIQIQKLKLPVTVDKDLNALRNAVTIVESSYVCPFLNTFSDYYCAYCREMFLDPSKLREHTLTHDPKTFQEFVDNKKLLQIDINRIDCRLCETKIDNIDYLKAHITTVHNTFLYSDVSTELLKFKLKLGTMSCLECDKTFSFFHALKKHMAEHFGTFICDVCGSHYFEERYLLVHKKTHKNAPIQMYPCDECEKTFRSKNSKNVHTSRIHKNEAIFPCNKCDEVFISYHMRYRHKMNVHDEKRHFPCESCNKIFDSRKTLRQHTQKSHLQLLRHECTLCDKKFYIPSALREHMTSHTGERNFRCDYCGKNYQRSKALKVHLESHNTEKKYKCSLCPRAYTQVTNYKNHLKTKHPT